MTHFNGYLQTLRGNLDRIEGQASALEDIARVVVEEKRSIVVTGVGKSAAVGRKFVASLQSISVQASFVHANEAAHGDLGTINRASMVIALSKSGNSAELVNLLPHLEARRCELVAIVNDPRSKLARAAHRVLLTEVEEEGDADNILPLISCEITLLFCDFLTARIAQLTHFRPDQFAFNHPGGQLGINLKTRVAELSAWKENRAFVRPETVLMDALLVCSQFRTGLVCVVDENESLLGVLSDGDFRRALTEGCDFGTQSVASLMNRHPVSIADNLLVGRALELMEARERSVLSAPVVRAGAGGRCLGIITIHHLFGG